MSSRSGDGRQFLSAGWRELPARQRPGAARYFFVGLSGVYALVPVVAFAPEYRDLSRGTFQFDFIPALAYAHGVLMMSWLLLFVAQSGLAAAGALKWHRILGMSSIGLAAAMWLSMGVESVGQLHKTRDFDTLLLQICIMVLFAVFFTWGVLVRRDTSSHKRLLTLAALVLLQAALDRIAWLPSFGLPGYWPNAVRLDVLLVPLLVFDLVTARRIHRATWIGLGTLVASQGAIILVWSLPGWQHFAHHAGDALR